MSLSQSEQMTRLESSLSFSPVPLTFRSVRTLWDCLSCQEVVGDWISHLVLHAEPRPVLLIRVGTPQPRQPLGTEHFPEALFVELVSTYPS